jgi:hypothetical protein
VDNAEASRITHGELRLWNPLCEEALDEVMGFWIWRPERASWTLDAGVAKSCGE